MMPLTFANVGEENCIRKIGRKSGNQKVFGKSGLCRWWFCNRGERNQRKHDC